MDKEEIHKELTLLAWLATLKENMERAERAFLSTDAREHIEGVRILRSQINFLETHMENRHRKMCGLREYFSALSMGIP